MSLADELIRLEELRQRGSLTQEEFQRAKQQILASPGSSEPLFKAINQFRRSPTDYWFGGVCGGLMTSTGVAAWVWRLMFALLLLACGTGLVAYLLIWLLVPQEPPNPSYRSQIAN